MNILSNQLWFFVVAFLDITGNALGFDCIFII